VTDKSSVQLRVTGARPGTVNFELDIQKEHTVRSDSFPRASPKDEKPPIQSRNIDLSDLKPI
jgi:hypothetical protein